MSQEQTQPLDEILNRHGLSNADLVKASTEQLTFKMVQKGRRGRRLTPNVQEKILNALLAAKPGLSYRRRDLFRYPLNEVAVDVLRGALKLAGERKISYPQFVDLLTEGGITGYTAEVAANRYTFYGTGGEAHVEQGPTVSDAPASPQLNVDALKAAIRDAQKHVIDHPTFLKRIHEAGVSVYEVNLRKRKIEYKGKDNTYKELIPLYKPTQDIPSPEPEPKPKAPAKKKKPGVVRTTRKQRLDFRRKLRAKKKASRKPKPSRTKIRK